MHTENKLNMITKINNYNNNHVGSVSYSAHSYGFGGNLSNSNCGNSNFTACGLSGRAVHERSHSDGTTAPLPSVDLSMESSSVTSLSNLPLRKTITSGKLEMRTLTSSQH